MGYSIHLEQFEGPLDLLIQLIEKEELAISEISLAKVTDQYLEYIETNIDVNPEEMVDFLVVATKLLLIKSKLLLPEPDVDEEQIDLSKQLKIYKEFLDASQAIQAMVQGEPAFFTRDVSPMKVEKVFSPPKDVGSEHLRDLFSQVLKRLEPIFVVQKSVIEKTISLKDKVSQIKSILKRRSQISFDSLIRASNSRTEVVVGFLALLELVKQREVDVLQDENFGEIIIKHPQPGQDQDNE